ncbi:MAG TPA: acetate--CoA ligase family protein, partial [Candidatus Saccharimonadales bacterium]|nr:acetate--CoA ligase family protein [Candidatus Saccharimonadales bacterium]
MTEPDRPSLDCIFRPKSIAVIGASRAPTSIGREILHNLVNNEFNGPVFPVNAKSPMVQSMKAYPSVLDIGDPVDLAIIVVPREAVPGVIDECGRKGVKGVVVITAGFKEVGGPGIQLEDSVVEKIRQYGIRMIGPNCMGVINTAPGVSMNATFAKAVPTRGQIGFVSQSGALGEAILANARDLGLGIAQFASIGNKSDVSGNDLLLYWENDPNVSLILLYLESFGNPRRFTEIARRITRRKPILAVKAGRTASGARAVGTHTGALAGLDVAVETLLEQCGVLRVSTIEEMFVYAQALTNQPMPKGNRVAVITNGGGPGILATDALENLKMAVAPLSEGSMKALREVLPAEATPANPIDLIASARADRYRAAVKIAAADPNVDALLIIFVSPIMIDAHSVAQAIVDSLQDCGKPAVACFMGKVGQEEGLRLLSAAGIPVYQFPELAAEALASMDRCYRLVTAEEGAKVRFDGDPERVGRVIEGVRKAGRTELTLMESLDVLDAYGIPCGRTREVTSTAEAIAFGVEAGYPIVLKISSSKVSHKSEAGGVKVDLRNGDEAGAAFADLKKRLPRFGPGARILAQTMLKEGREVIFGVTTDVHYGPLAMFGLGGVYVEVLKDVAFKILPLTDLDADRMIRSIRGFPLLQGVRGEGPVDLGILREVLLRVSQLVTENPGMDSLDINPFIVSENRESSAAVDARIHLKTVAAEDEKV